MSVRVENKPRVIDATITRPNNATQYAAGDQVASSATAGVALSFEGAALGIGGKGTVIGGVCIASSNQTVKPNFELYLFEGSAAPTSQNDNAAWAPTDANMANFFGKLDFDEWVTCNTASGADGNAISESGEVKYPFKCASGSITIYGLVVERGTYTPLALETFKFRLRVE